MPRTLLVLLAAMALSACSGGDEPAGNSQISGGPVFMELVEDARVAARDGKLSEAAGYYDEALALEPENPGLWVDIARLRFRGGEHLIAIEAADRALELDPDYAPALLMRAQLVRDAHGMVESLPWYEAAVTADPRNPEVVADYAATLGDLGRYKDMLAVVRNLAEIAPSHPQVYYLQAVLAARAEDPVLAGSLLDRSGLAEQGVPAAMLLDAIIDMQEGNFDTASGTLDDLSGQQPGNARVDELLARALWMGGRDDAMITRFAARAERGDASPYLTMLVGRSLERDGQRERAIPLIERALEPQSEGLIVLEGSARGSGSMPAATAELRDYVAAGNVRAARRLSGILLEQAPYSADFHALAGDTALIGGDTQGALELYEVAARVRRSWPLTRKLIHAFDLAGDGVTSEVLLSRYIAGDPLNSEALLLLAERSAAREDWLRVAVLLDTAIAQGSGNDIEVLALRGAAARALGRTEEAERFETLLRELDPGDFL